MFLPTFGLTLYVLEVLALSTRGLADKQTPLLEEWMTPRQIRKTK